MAERDWHIPMGVVMRRETFTGSGKRPRCSVRPPTYEGRHVASGPGYGVCGEIGRWRRGEQHLCDFHAGVAATLDAIDQQVRPARACLRRGRRPLPSATPVPEGHAGASSATRDEAGQ